MFRISKGWLLHTIRINPLSAKLNPICHFLALLAHHILHVRRIRVKQYKNEVPKYCSSLRMSKTWLQVHWVNLFLEVCNKSTYLFCADNRDFVNRNLNYSLLPCSDAADHLPFIILQKCQSDITCRTFVHPYHRQSSQETLQVPFSYLGNAGVYWVVTVKERCVRWEA
jgi:hypothetical protein